MSEILIFHLIIHNLNQTYYYRKLDERNLLWHFWGKGLIILATGYNNKKIRLIRFFLVSGFWKAATLNDYQIMSSNKKKFYSISKIKHSYLFLREYIFDFSSKVLLDSKWSIPTLYLNFSILCQKLDCWD